MGEKWIYYYVGLGSNMGNREAYLRQGRDYLAAHADIILVACSTVSETAPWGNTEQNAFLNQICCFKTTLAPQAMLSVMQSVEQQAGRRREIHWGPRTLDLDIIWAEDEEGVFLQIDTGTLKIPHPYFWERAFVLRSLCELYPDFVYQDTSISVRLTELDSNE